jgi:hypothetical protein
MAIDPLHPEIDAIGQLVQRGGTGKPVISPLVFDEHLRDFFQLGFGVHHRLKGFLPISLHQKRTRSKRGSDQQGAEGDKNKSRL